MSNWTPKIDDAIRKASILHEEQKRKGEAPTPVLTHLVAVALIASDYTDDEDTLCAAVLHDTIEDTHYTAAELEEDFGERVKDIVLGVTLPPESLGLSWKEGRDRYIEHLREASIESCLVSASDKIHNFYSIQQDFNPEKFKENFTNAIDERIETYSRYIAVIKGRLGDHPIIARLEKEYKSYKVFLTNVQKES